MFVFLHVPKSAGTTIHHVMLDQYKPRLSGFRTFQVDLWNPQEAAEAFLAMPRAAQNTTEIIHGHLSYGLHAFLPMPVTYFTMLREPVERVISHYYYVLHSYILSDTLDGKPNNHPDRQRVLDGKLTLADYVSSGYCWEMDNGQTRIFAGENGLPERTPFGQCTPALLEEAKANLRDHMAVVGLTERFDESLLLVQRLCQWRTPFYVRHNVTHTRPRRSEIPAETLQTITDWNCYDLELYAYGVQLFEKQMAGQGPNFAADVKQFQALNRKYGPLVCNWNLVTRALRKRARRLAETLTGHGKRAMRPTQT